MYVNWQNELVDSLANQRYWVSQNLITESVVKELKLLAEEKYHKNMFHAASVGKGHLKKQENSIRNDEIFWIKDWSEGRLLDYEQMLEEISQLVRKELFLSIKRYESHFAYYRPGAKYVKHRDRHKESPSRVLTCVCYLSDWQPGYGGELMLYLPETKVVIVKPSLATIVLFDSRLEHEVLASSSHRWSLTTWFRDDM